MAIPSLQLQKAIYSTLSTKYKVYDSVPSGASFPYIQFGTESVTTNDTKTNRRTVHNVTLHTWTKSSSSTSSKELNHFVLTTILDGLVVDFFNVQLIRLNFLSTLKEMDESEIFHHGILEFEITLQEVE